MKASRKTLFALIGAMAMGAAMAAPSVEIVSVQQQYPWTNTVDIVYNVAGVASDTNGYFVAFTPTTQEGTPIEDINGETSIQVALSCTTNGAVAQWFPQTNQQYTACKMIPAVYRGGSGGGNDYMIVDLLTGAVIYEPMATQEASNERYNTQEYKTTKMVFRRIPAGTYDVMDGAKTAYMEKDYYIGVFIVTEGQYNAIMGSGETSSEVPKSSISWNEVRGSALALASLSDKGSGPLSKLNAKVHTAGNAGLYFDLPDEAMWEVASRANCPANWCRYWGTTTTADATGQSEYCVGVSSYATRPYPGVGTKLPNAWGLYDTIGLRWEWCRDTFSQSGSEGRGESNFVNYMSYTQTPLATGSGNAAAVRGGPSGTEWQRCSSIALRHYRTCTEFYHSFRIAMIVND